MLIDAVRLKTNAYTLFLFYFWLQLFNIDWFLNDADIDQKKKYTNLIILHWGNLIKNEVSSEMNFKAFVSIEGPTGTHKFNPFRTRTESILIKGNNNFIHMCFHAIRDDILFLHINWSQLWVALPIFFLQRQPPGKVTSLEIIFFKRFNEVHKINKKAFLQASTKGLNFFIVESCRKKY